jgi:hypothetical protein
MEHWVGDAKSHFDSVSIPALDDRDNREALFRVLIMQLLKFRQLPDA